MEDYIFFYTIIGLAMITGQIMAVVIMFGGRKKASNNWRISIGIALILMLISMMGLVSE